MKYYSEAEIKAMHAHMRLVDIAKSANKAALAGLKVTAPSEWEGFNLLTCDTCKGVGDFANMSANSDCSNCQGTGVADRRGRKWKLSGTHGAGGVLHHVNNWREFVMKVEACDN